MQVTINLDNDLITKIDEGATREGVSRSKYIKKCVTGYFNASTTTESDKATYVDEITRLQKDNAVYVDKITDLEKDIAKYVDKITNLQNDVDFLRNQNTMLLARIPIALPPAKPILTRIKELFRGSAAKG